MNFLHVWGDNIANLPQWLWFQSNRSGRVGEAVPRYKKVSSARSVPCRAINLA
jgi:hypothetical protein